MGGWQDDVPRSFENLSYGPLKAFLVFHKKDSAHNLNVSNRSLVSPDHFNWFIDARQIDLKGRAAIQFGVEPNMSLKLLHDGVDSGQAEPRAVTSRLRCKEWLKNARSDFGTDADSRIAD